MWAQLADHLRGHASSADRQLDAARQRQQRHAIRQSLRERVGDEDAFLGVLSSADDAMRQRVLLGSKGDSPFLEEILTAAQRADSPRVLLAVRAEMLAARAQLPARSGARLAHAAAQWDDAHLSEHAVQHRKERLAAQLVEEGVLPAPEFLCTFGVEHPLAERWLSTGALTADQLLVERWQPHALLPPTAMDLAHRARSPEEVLREAYLPGRPGETRRLDYAARLLAEYLLARASPPPALEEPEEWPTHGVWDFAALARAAGSWLTRFVTAAWTTAWPAPEAKACAACCEPFTAEAPAKNLTGCAHAPEFCAHCLNHAVEVAHNGHCPTQGCATLITPQDGHAAGLPGERLSALARQLVRASLGTMPNWIGCDTPQCPGGARIPLGATAETRCAPCGKAGVVANRETVAPANHPEILALIDDMGPGTHVGKTRECYECGTAVLCTADCSHITCNPGQGAQEHGWDMIGGRYPRPDLAGEVDGSQRYVPRTGWLVRAGLYEGLTPGATNVHVQEVARANARRLGIVRRLSAAERLRGWLGLGPRA